MKFLKRTLLVLAILTFILAIAGLFMTEDFAVKREIVINKSNKEVFAYIKLLKNQTNFGTWFRKDLKMKKTYTGTDGTVGFIYAWDSKVEGVGTGEQEITKIVEGKRMEFDLRFKKPMEADNLAYMTTVPVSENKTKITWGFTGKMNYPMNIFLPIINMDKMVGKDFQEGLENLKVILEK